MRDIPVFATENGVGSLVLKEIPYSGAAYITFRDADQPEAFAEECVSFCRAVGAENVYATGHPYLESYPFHTAVLRMTRSAEGLPETDAVLLPVTEQTLEHWRGTYNRAMAAVPNASYMTLADAKKMLGRGDGYFVHRGNVLIGIGMAAGDKIDAVVSVQPGAGKDVVVALTHVLSGERIELEVASTNERAVRLYKRLGFLRTMELSRWYRLFKGE